MDWPKFERIDRDAGLWSLAVAAVKEIQSLSIHREAGQKAARETTEAGLAASLAAWQKDTLPLGTAGVQLLPSRWQGQPPGSPASPRLHGLWRGEGKKRAALKTLLQRTEEREAVPA
jgi:hypothetical protein